MNKKNISMMICFIYLALQKPLESIVRASQPKEKEEETLEQSQSRLISQFIPTLAIILYYGCWTNLMLVFISDVAFESSSLFSTFLERIGHHYVETQEFATAYVFIRAALRYDEWWGYSSLSALKRRYVQLTKLGLLLKRYKDTYTNSIARLKMLKKNC